jgi:hypothetical protein
MGKTPSQLLEGNRLFAKEGNRLFAKEGNRLFAKAGVFRDGPPPLPGSGGPAPYVGSKQGGTTRAIALSSLQACYMSADEGAFLFQL